MQQYRNLINRVEAVNWNEQDPLWGSRGRNTYATLQYGSAFRWGAHFVKIQGTKGAILIELQEAKVVLRTNDKEEQFLLHASKEEDGDRARIYQGLDDGIMHGEPNQNVQK